MFEHPCYKNNDPKLVKQFWKKEKKQNLGKKEKQNLEEKKNGKTRI